ncbi:MAG: hypothetical protein ACREE6_00995 [Limisphaerales bacterium]
MNCGLGCERLSREGKLTYIKLNNQMPSVFAKATTRHVPAS